MFGDERVLRASSAGGEVGKVFLLSIIFLFSSIVSTEKSVA
jgi:hypothetical protein